MTRVNDTPYDYLFICTGVKLYTLNLAVWSLYCLFIKKNCQWIFVGKNGNFWQFFDIQLAIFRGSGSSIVWTSHCSWYPFIIPLCIRSRVMLPLMIKTYQIIICSCAIVYVIYGSTPVRLNVPVTEFCFCFRNRVLPMQVSTRRQQRLI